MDPVTTREQAIQRALDWAEGRLSHINTFMEVEGRSSSLGVEGDERQRTLAWCEMADAQEVVKWAALAQVLLSEQGDAGGG